MNYQALMLILINGCFGTGAYLFYAKAFRGELAPSVSVKYIWGLCFNPWFVLGLVLSLIGTIGVQFVFSKLGVQRAWFSSLFILGFQAVLFLVILHEPLSKVQWVGVGTVTVGALLVMGK
jgi:drug/metabolite transporter (DMT)-like permease